MITPQTIALVQSLLNRKRGASLVVDGIHGSKTDGALESLLPTTPTYLRALPILLPNMHVDNNGDPHWGLFARHLGIGVGLGFGLSPRGVPGDFLPVGVMMHHTGGPAGRMQVPYDRFAKGSKRLVGPICHFTASRNGTVDCITNGRAHHAGRGNSHRLWLMEHGYEVGQTRNAMTDTRDVPGLDDMNGNSHFYGIEMDHTGNLDERWDRQEEVGIELAAMYCYAWGWDPSINVIGHKEWTRRKVDPCLDMYMFRQHCEDELTHHETARWEIAESEPEHTHMCPHCGSALALTVSL